MLSFVGHLRRGWVSAVAGAPPQGRNQWLLEMLLEMMNEMGRMFSPARGGADAYEVRPSGAATAGLATRAETPARKRRAASAQRT